MDILIFNGSIETRKNSTGYQLAGYISAAFQKKGYAATVFHLAEADIPFFKMGKETPPPSVQKMCAAFKKAELHIWLTPLFHGSMTGAMKNCLDWLELTSKDERPYLTGKIIGLICWAGGAQAMQGVNAMDAVAKSLRAWVLPFCVPIVKAQLFDEATANFAHYYQDKIAQLIALLIEAKPMITTNMGKDLD